MAEIISNPPVVAQNNLQSFFGFLSNIASPLIAGKLQNEANESAARSAARVQQVMNKYHQVDPSLGANDPKAAQAAANRTFLERFLPTSMLYQVDTVTGSKTPSMTYYVVMGGLLILLVVFVRRLLR
jgi:hypothetical protein